MSEGMLNRTAKHFVDPKSRFKLILSVYLILIKDGNVLLLRRANTGYEDGNYGLPAGHADGDETSRKATAREAEEEAGVKVNSRNLKFVHVMHRRQEDERVDLFFTTDKWEGGPKNMEPEKCDDLSWFPLDNLPPNTIPYIRQALEHYQQGIYYSEFGWKGIASGEKTNDKYHHRTLATGILSYLFADRSACHTRTTEENARSPGPAAAK